MRKTTLNFSFTATCTVPAARTSFSIPVLVLAWATNRGAKRRTFLSYSYCGNGTGATYVVPILCMNDPWILLAASCSPFF
jgi:hypothetical protein